MRNAIGARLAVLKVVLLVAGIAMIAMSMGDAVKIWKNDFGKLYDKGINEFNEDELVTGKVEFVLDPIATLESSQTVYGIPVSKKMTPYYLCLIPYNEKTNKEGYYLIVHATNKDTINAMDSLVISTAFALEHSDQEVQSNKKPVSLEAKTRTIPDEVMDYALEYMRDGESSDAEIKSYWFIISKKRTKSFKNSRTHYVNQGPSDLYNTPPVPREGASGQPMRRYSPDAYNAHTYAGGISPEQGGMQQNGQQQAGRRYDPSAYGGGGDYQPGEMDSIDTSNLKL